jgi:uncharacterized protein (TIGR03086 family)
MSFSRTTELPVSVDEAFALITEPERLRRWTTVSAVVDLRVGGEFRWTVTPGHVAGGTFREVEPGKRVVFGWGWTDSEELPLDASTVTVTLEETPDGCRVTLEHDGLTDAEAARHAEGWNHYLERLEKLASTGDAGQDEWAWVPESLDPISAAEAVLAAIQPVLRGLVDEDKPKPTPCTEMNCHQVAVHLMESLVGLGAMAGTEVTDPDTVGGSLENKVSTMAAQAIEAWRTVDLSGTVVGRSGADLPASYAAGLLPVELLLHTWDLAQGSGQSLVVSDDVVDYLRELSAPLMPSARERGVFAAEVSPADDAGALDRFAAYAGRTPISA